MVLVATVRERHAYLGVPHLPHCPFSQGPLDRDQAELTTPQMTGPQ